MVVIRSWVAMLSFRRMGIPWRGPLTCPASISRSRASAISRASGLVSMTLRSVGPWRSISSIRWRYISVISREVHRPPPYRRGGR